MINEIRKKVFLRAIFIGIWGSIIWGIFFLFMYYFNMVEVNHINVLKKIVNHEWTNQWYAHIIFLLMLSIVSILVAMLYFFLLRNKKSWTVGVMYGAVVWLIIYYILPVLTTGFNPFTQFNFQTHIGLFCNVILYGVFVGYTISYDNEQINLEYKLRDKDNKEEEYQI